MTDVPADTYLSFVVSRPLFEVWNLFLLAMARIVPIVAISPFFGGKALSDPLKMGFGVALSIIFLPFLITHSKGTIITNYSFIFMLVKEVFIGALLGYLISIPYYIAQSTGSLIDHQRGAQSLQVSDPMTSAQTSPIGTLLANIMLVIFYSTGGVLVVFEAVFQSYTLIPADSFLNPDFFTITRPLWTTVIDLAHTVMRLTVQLSAPALLILLLSDVFLGVANRMAPQVQVTFLLYSLKSFMGIAIMWLGWWLIIKQFNVELLSWYKLFKKVVLSF